VAEKRGKDVPFLYRELKLKGGKGKKEAAGSREQTVQLMFVKKKLCREGR